MDDIRIELTRLFRERYRIFFWGKGFDFESIGACITLYTPLRCRHRKHKSIATCLCVFRTQVSVGDHDCNALGHSRARGDDQGAEAPV